MAQEVYISGATYSAVPGIRLPDSNGNYHQFSDPSVTTAVESDVEAGKIFLLADGTQATGTGSGTPSATQHTIYFEFSDETSTTITAYYDSAFISNAIRATTPTTYDSKTVQQASLDGVAWYTKPSEDYETVWEGTSFVNAGTTTNVLWVEQMSNTPITLGDEWRISIDGVSYICSVQNNGEDNYVGNPLYDGETDDGSGIPFIMYNYGWGAWNGNCATTITGDMNHTFKFERKIS